MIQSIGLLNVNDQMVLNHEIHAHDDWVTAVCFGSNETFISGSNDCTLKIWKIDISSNDDLSECLKSWDINANHFTFTVLHILKSHTGSITDISFYVSFTSTLNCRLININYILRMKIYFLLHPMMEL